MSVPRTVRLRARALAKTEGIRYTAALRRVEEDWAREHSATKSEYRNEECDETDETCSNCGCLGGFYREDWGAILCPECFARFKEARHALGLLDVPATKETIRKVTAPILPGKETCPGQFIWSAFGANYPDTVCASVLDWDEAGYYPVAVLCDADDDHRPKDVPCPFCDSEGFVRWTWGGPDEYSLVWESDRSAVKPGTEIHFHEDTEKRSLWWTATRPTRGEERVRFIARVEKAFRENISVVLPRGFEPARHEARLLQKMSDARGSGWHVDHYESDREVVLTRTVIAYVEDDDWDAETDGEEFCSRCFAGVDSSEHHSMCVRTGWAEDGESAPEAAPTWAERPGPQSDGDCYGTRCDDCGCCEHSGSCRAAMDGGCSNSGCGCAAAV